MKLLESVIGIRGKLFRDSIYSFSLKIFSTGLSFGIGLLLARLLGVEGFGIYSYVMSWIALLCVASVFGLDRLLVRDVASYRAQSGWGMIRGIVGWADRLALFNSFSLILIAVGVTEIVLKGSFDPPMLRAFRVGLIMLPFLTLLRLKSAGMTGLHYTIAGQIPEMLARPILFLLLIGGAYFYTKDNLTATSVLAINGMACVVVFFALMKITNALFAKYISDVPPQYDKKVWMQSAFPLLFISGMNIILGKTDVIVLGIMREASDVGVYVAASRGAEFIAFAILSINAILAPTIASAYANRDMGQLQKVVTKSARLMMLLSLPILLFLMYFSGWFLSLFGREFVLGETALKILCVGNFFNSAMGSVGLLLVMTGDEISAAIGVGLGAVLNIILNLLLIPRWGMEGAAIATVLSMVLWNVLLIWFVWSKLGINPTAFGKLRHG